MEKLLGKRQVLQRERVGRRGTGGRGQTVFGEHDDREK